MNQILLKKEGQIELRLTIFEELEKSHNSTLCVNETNIALIEK